MLDTLRTLFPRPVRASLYGSASALVAALVAKGDLPWWAVLVDAPLLLALLHLTPDDVDPAPTQD